jgi:hypothetical protein
MAFLKETLKRLRAKLLVKVLEKQDELSIKVEDSTNITATRLSEIRQSVETAAKETLASITKSQAEVLTSIEKTAASTANKQNIAELRGEIKTLLTTVKSQAEVLASIKKTVASMDAEKVGRVALKTERNLQNYLRLLKDLSKRYMALIAVKNTTGHFITEEIAAGIRELGFTTDLSFEKGLKNQHYHTYIGVIDRGQVICDAVSKQKESAYYTAMRDGVSYEAISKSLSEGNVAVIKIDGVDYATNRRGLNIVVFDPITKTVIDSVCFDTYVSSLACWRLEDIVEGRRRMMNAFAICGYTVPQYCVDAKITNVIVYSESEYWNTAEDICLSFSLNHKVNVRAYCAAKPFKRTPVDDDYLFTSVNFINIDDVKLTPADTVLVIHPNPQTEIVKRFETSGVRVVDLEQMATKMRDYIFTE